MAKAMPWRQRSRRVSKVALYSFSLLVFTIGFLGNPRPFAAAFLALFRAAAPLIAS
jgi:hypothetical protein